MPKTTRHTPATFAPINVQVEDLDLESMQPGRRIGRIAIGGVNFHVDCTRVHRKNPSKAINPEYQHIVDAVKKLDGADTETHLRTVEIEGDLYFVLIFPTQI